MFGLIYAIGMFIGSGIEHARRHSINSEMKHDGYHRMYKGQNPHGTYYDWQGKERDLSTNKCVVSMRINDENVLFDTNDNLLRNFTQEKIWKEVEENRNNSNGKQLIKQYHNGQLHSMWMNKYFGDKRNVFDFTQHIDVYIHCKTKRQCVLSNEFPEYDKRTNHFYKDLNIIANNILRGSNNLDWSLSMPTAQFIVDLMTGKIIEIRSQDYLNDNYPQEDMIFYEVFNDKVKYSLEDTKRVIKEYNRRIDNKEIEPCLTGWELLFV